MNFLIIVIMLFAGVLAGAVTGFFSGSTTIAIAPVLIIFYNIHPYKAVGIAMGIDVFTAVVVFNVYWYNKRVKAKPIIPMVVSIAIGIIIGSFISAEIPSRWLSIVLAIGILCTSIKFLFAKEEKSAKGKECSKWIIIPYGILSGIFLGIFGGGGGIFLFIGLSFFFDYSIHDAIGTSALGMIFLALINAAAHYGKMPFPFFYVLYGLPGAVISAFYCAKFANNMSAKKLNKLVAIILVILGLALLVKSML